MATRTGIARRRRGGFTLLELLLVTVVLGMLMAIMLPAFQYLREHTRNKRVESERNALTLACRNYKLEKNHWPLPNGTEPEEGAPLEFVDDNYEIVDILTGGNIKFLKTSNYHTDGAGNVLDPARKPYKIVFFLDDNERIDVKVERQ
ncbi:prepilin-type N-terminal cleavage/methylation domain-containing protein [Verrucomicrobiota bacterium]